MTSAETVQNSRLVQVLKEGKDSGETFKKKIIEAIMILEQEGYGE